VTVSVWIRKRRPAGERGPVGSETVPAGARCRGWPPPGARRTPRGGLQPDPGRILPA